MTNRTNSISRKSKRISLAIVIFPILIAFGAVFIIPGIPLRRQSVHSPHEDSKASSHLPTGNLYLDPFVHSGRKVILAADAFVREQPRHVPLEFSKQQFKPDPLVRAGTRLAVLVDEACKSTASFLGLQHAGLTAAAPRIRSRALTIGKPILLSTLETLASEDPCVKGVSHNRRLFTDGYVTLNILQEALETTRIPLSRTSKDPMLPQQSHLAALGTQETYDFFFNPQGGIQEDVLIAVIDTGIDVGHPELIGHLWSNPTEVNGTPGVDDDGNGYVDDLHGFNFPDNSGDPAHLTVNDHGTHVAGLIAAAAHNGIGGMGVMGDKTRIIPLNVFGRNWGADTVDVDNAIRFAADLGSNVINISITGTGTAETTASALAYALSKGVTIVVSAGNLKTDINQEFFSPASYSSRYPGMLAVASFDARTGMLCDDSNFGRSSVKIGAPGCDKEAPKQGLLSTAKAGRFSFRKGTSMAAPLVTGAAALTYGWIRDRGKHGLSPAEVEALLVKSSAASPFLSDYIDEGHRLSLPGLSELLLKQ